MELSGPDWVSKFPPSKSLDALIEPMRTGATQFVAALRAAGATVMVADTLRPPQRAYLMHYSFLIARQGLDPATVPAMAGVDIQWVHVDAAGAADVAASKAAAEKMVQTYGVVFLPVLNSRHTEGRAVDMDILWPGTLNVARADGTMAAIASTPRTGAANVELHAVGATYGVIKLVTDAPHWSADGH